MRICCIALVVVAGCAVDDRTDTSGTEGKSEDAPDRELNVQLRVVDEAGQSVELNRFAAKTDAYFTVNISDPDQPVTPEDFVFQVVDATGSLKSSDAPSCRRFHVDESGTIDSAGICDHAIAHLDDGTTLIGVAPFTDATKYSLQITADDGERISVPFSVEP
jgi:hypothetical protein